AEKNGDGYGCDLRPSVAMLPRVCAQEKFWDSPSVPVVGTIRNLIWRVSNLGRSGDHLRDTAGLREDR
ncbi:MAG TPA: hypothetical protein VKJ01_19615, partial [Candidatus Solibacter sp.]|nr:hypothetical protein [Candidatus Solibacter sp.]